MTFEITWDKKAIEFLRKLDKPVYKRIVQKVDDIKSDPKRYLGAVERGGLL